MEDSRAQLLQLLASLPPEQLELVLAYARALRDGRDPFASHGLEQLLEETA